MMGAPSKLSVIRKAAAFKLGCAFCLRFFFLPFVQQDIICLADAAAAGLAAAGCSFAVPQHERVVFRLQVAGFSGFKQRAD